MPEGIGREKQPIADVKLTTAVPDLRQVLGHYVLLGERAAKVAAADPGMHCSDKRRGENNVKQNFQTLCRGHRRLVRQGWRP